MKRLADQTLYEILEVPRDAPATEIAAAVERARALYGPGSLATYSLMTPEDAALLGARIEEAHRVLLDPDARNRYDASLALPAEAVRAAANGTNGAATTPAFSAPPVIPAVKAEERAAPEPAPEPEPAGPRAPIRLEREIPAPPAAAATTPPAATAAPSPVPVPATAAAPAPAAEVPMPDGAAWTGEALRRVREARGISLQQIAERTKVTRHHVDNIESERFSSLPAPVYLRGILLAIARELRLDGQKVARAYLERAAQAQKR